MHQPPWSDRGVADRPGRVAQQFNVGEQISDSWTAKFSFASVAATCSATRSDLAINRFARYRQLRWGACHDLTRYAIKAYQCCRRGAVLTVSNYKFVLSELSDNDGTKARPGKSLSYPVDVPATSATDRLLERGVINQVGYCEPPRS